MNWLKYQKICFYKIMKEGIELELFDIGNKPTQVIGYTAHRI